MPWFQKSKKIQSTQKKAELPDGLWLKCDNCGEIIFRRELQKNASVCQKCRFHFRISSREYIEMIADEGSYREFNADMKSSDPLKFKDTKRYPDRIQKSTKKAGMNDAIRTGIALLNDRKIVLGIMDFNFFGGSVGSVVGEKIVQATRRAKEGNYPFILICASGGMRMQEGLFSLMQMAKTSCELAEFAQTRLPFITVLTHPTTGGTTASFAMLGDVIIAEPGALIGFAGPRVIKQTIGQDLPPGFQRAEFLLQHGFLDMIVDRTRLRGTLSTLIMHLHDADDSESEEQVSTVD
ncbi:acetyl-CoA carboxylase, carboxyltransferase subunit beta [candidate division LCP-89 bacterium B3_LCP]|uniref:Acetyl-coenzyme A carboxylase carboxyl transferase subunit beta n=1 Tax=candidate division LCP-89 bacterium B3_LCP TaxID=2012998 RepID=A0A532UY38_UNCL8|nr:MAG: acetyl-CoA carboxylase, carboxyltransferase subunit beta [candidate division LCP-89 bacterium B3_LCP]